MAFQCQDTPDTYELQAYDTEPDGSQNQEDGDASSTWGTLFPESEGFTKIALKNDRFEYTFGRKENAHFAFDREKWPYKKQEYQAISAVHFSLRYVVGSHGGHVELENHGVNGTFVNTHQIVFTFVDAVDESLPKGLTDRYHIPTGTLGKGAMGEVRLAIRHKDAKCFAVKIIDKLKFSYSGGTVNEDKTEEVAKEIDILKHTDHPCVIQIFDVFQTPETAFLFLELANGGELFDRIVNSENKRFDEATSKFYFIQILKAIKYLHDKGISHRDVKPENLLLTTKEPFTRLKVSDFGLAKHFDRSVMVSFNGTELYMAPEVWHSDDATSEGYSEKVDLWSAGVVLFACLSGQPAFHRRKELPLEQQIKKGRYNFNNSVWKSVSENAKSMIRGLLTVDPENRMNAEQALNHSWISQDTAMITRVNLIMYPSSDGMLPPGSPVRSPGKKRPRLLEAKEEVIYNAETDGEEEENEDSVLDSSSTETISAGTSTTMSTSTA